MVQKLKIDQILLLPGLLNSDLDRTEEVADLVEALAQDFNKALREGERHRARMLLRFFASLVATHVLQPESVLGGFQSLVEVAQDIAIGGKEPIHLCTCDWIPRHPSSRAHVDAI